MNRTDRLLATVLELQGRGRATAAHLARTFGVSIRTVYRDIAALNEAGVPIVSAPGQGYWLMEGYFLPPLRFSAEEATLLLLGSEVMAQSFDDRWRASAEGAARKIEGVLPEADRAEVDYLRRNIRFVQVAPRDADGIHALLRTLRGAVLERRTVRFRYTKRDDSSGVRDADPHGLYRVDGVWMVSAWCHLRKAMRVFRLSRIDDLEVTDAVFERRSTPLPQRMGRDDPERRTEVRLRFPAEADRWLRETPSPFVVARERDGATLLLTLRLRRVDDLLPWLRSWGPQVEVLTPAELRDRLRAEAETVLQRYAPVQAADD